MASTYVRQPETPFARWMAVMAIAATALAPVPVWGQSSGGEAEQQDSGQTESKQKQPDQADKQSAGGTPSLYLLPVDRVQSSISDIVPDRIDDLVRKDVKSDGRVQLRPNLGTGNRDDTAGSRAVAEARKKYRSGIGLVSAGEYEEAVETLSTAVSTMKKHVEHLRNFGVLVDALKNLARAYGGAGFDFDARTTMREFAHLKPDASLDPEKFPEKLRRIYKAEAKKVRSAGPGKLTINATSNNETVKGATVEIDGVEKGKTPAKVNNVGFGYHYLVVRGPDGETVGTKRLQVRGRGESQSFTVALSKGDTGAQQADKSKQESLPAFYTDLRESLRSGRFDQSSLKPYLNELSEESDAEVIVWVLMTRDDDGYNAIPFGYRNNDSKLVKGESVEFNVQLSNLRSGVSELSDRVVKTAIGMQDAESTETVALVGEDEKAAGTGSKSAAATTGQETTAKTEAEQSTKTAKQTERVDPPPQPEQPTEPQRDSGISPWWYVAGSAVVVGGLAAGGAVLLSNSGSPTKPEGFEAQVSW